MKLYRIFDCQLGCWFSNGKIYKGIKEVIEHLINYHSIDFEGETENQSMVDYMKKYKTDKDKINFLSEYGEWDIEETNIKELEKEYRDLISSLDYTDFRSQYHNEDVVDFINLMVL